MREKIERKNATVKDRLAKSEKPFGPRACTLASPRLAPRRRGARARALSRRRRQTKPSRRRLQFGLGAPRAKDVLARSLALLRVAAGPDETRDPPSYFRRRARRRLPPLLAAFLRLTPKETKARKRCVVSACSKEVPNIAFPAKNRGRTVEDTPFLVGE